MEKRKVLFVATVVKTHIMQFHIPYLKMFQDMGWETVVASRNDYFENPEECRIPYCDHFYDIPFDRIPWKKGNLTAYRIRIIIFHTTTYFSFIFIIRNLFKFSHNTSKKNNYHPAKDE